MSLETAIKTILLEYPKFSKENFREHEFASYIRNKIPESLTSSLELPSIYHIKASAGNGSWAKVPWIAVFNRLVTESVKSGFYCIYLFRADFLGVFLSLNQGFADKRDEHGLGARKILKAQARLYRSLLSPEEMKEFSDVLNLNLDVIPKETTSRRLGQAYEAGNIVSKFYSHDAIPDDHVLADDLRSMLNLYFSLLERASTADDDEMLSPEQGEWFEDLTKYRVHRTAERNYALSKKVKQLQGCVCKACGFDFESKYGDIGKSYIEAHHIVPMSELDKTKIQLDPIRDFTVLCSNCHRMIHRVKPTPTLEEFKALVRDGNE